MRFLLTDAKSCLECPIHYEEYGIWETHYYCSVTDRKVDLYDTKRPKDCPLKELPKEKHLSNTDEVSYYTFGKTVGYNACIDEILGENNGKGKSNIGV